MNDLRRACIAGALLASVAFPGSARLAQAAPEVERHFGLIPATAEDLRRVEVAKAPFSGAALPRSVDLSPSMPPPQDQGAQSSCVGWAVAYALKTYQEKIEEDLPIRTPDGRVDAHRVFSPGFVYSQVNQGQDHGCKLEDALNLVRDQGAAPWADMPYEESKPFERPSVAARRAARRYRIDKWDQVPVADVVGLKAQLSTGYPVVFGARVDQGFKELRSGAWSAPYGKELGNHAMVLVGYDDGLGAFKVINSWGPQWGKGGYGWIAYDHFRRVASEAYVAKDARNDRPPDVEPPAPEPSPVEPVPPEPSPVPPSPIAPPPDVPPEIPVLPPPPLPTAFSLDRVEYNARLPMDPTGTLYLLFHGRLVIPAGAGYSDQVVVSFYFADEQGRKGGPVPAKFVQYSTVFGQAACGTAVYPVPPQGLGVTEWHVWIPNDALDIVPGAYEMTPNGPVALPQRIRLLAEPVLYVDRFAVATGTLVDMLVTR